MCNKVGDLHLKKYYDIFILLSFIGILSPVYAEIKVSSFPVITVDKSNVNVFSTPIAHYQGAIYTVNIEPGLSGVSDGVDLNTKIRKSVLINNQWQWLTTAIDNKTIKDAYHTQPSIGIDKDGYIHVAYGMHNMPWQYVISNAAGDISSFSFHGDAITIQDKIAVKHLNITQFPSRGTALIPGNQITYPAFFYDSNNDLYITYRFAVHPKLRFKYRGFSGAIARYNTLTKKWASIGGSILIGREEANWSGLANARVSNPFAFESQWTVYLPRLAFDNANTMHVSWLWRKGLAGSDASHPSYAYSPHDESTFYKSSQCPYSLPISVEVADWIGGIPNEDKYHSISDIAVNEDHVYIVLDKIGATRELNIFDRKQSKWLESEKMPWGASSFKLDSKGGQWAFATGLTVFYRTNGKENWNIVYNEDNRVYAYPKIIPVSDKNEFYIHTQSLDKNSVKIYKLEY
jgi:hypothetical protein